MPHMDKKVQELTLLVNKLQERINRITDGSSLSSIEKDIILDLLRRAYVTTEELGTFNSPSSLTDEIADMSPATESEESIPMETVDTFDKEEISKPDFHEMPTFESRSDVASKVEDKPEEVVERPNEVTFVMSEPQVYQPQNTQPIEPVKIESPKSTDVPADLFSTPTIADKLKSNSLSLNDTITGNKEDQSVAHKMQLKPISDLKAAIGINEKFQFVNDLFEGRIDKYNEAITRLNSCSSLYEANGVLSRLNYEHNWNEGSEACNKLSTFITRRYL